MNVTDGDRAKAMFALFPELSNRVGGYIDGLTFSDEAEANMRAVAAALAEEREKARAPFLALAAEYEQEDPRINRNTMAIFRAVTHDLRRVAEESE